MRSTNNSPPSNIKKKLYLSIYTYIKLNSKLPDLGIKKTTLQYYLTTLKQARLVKKIGYGVWEAINDYDEIRVKQVQFNNQRSSVLTVLDPKKREGGLKKTVLLSQNLNTPIRSHAFQFTIRVPSKINNWKKRETYLKRKKIHYEPHKIKSIGQRLIISNKKVWLTNKSIVIFDSKDYLVESASQGKNYAIGNMLDIVEKIERLLGCSFKIKKRYLFRVTRQHHAMIHNELAKSYRENGKKLYIYDHQGMWMWIDFSDGIDEKEIGNRIDADRIADMNIIPFYNGLKEVSMKGFTPQWVTNSFGELIQDRKYYAENNRSHVGAVKDLGKGVRILIQAVKKLDKKISKKKL